MTVAERAFSAAEQLDLEQEGVLLHEADKEPQRVLCGGCLRPVIVAEVRGEIVVADCYEWLPRGECLSCAHTRHAHPFSKVDCNRCGGTGMVGEPRPPGEMLAIDVAWADDVHLRIVGPNTDRRRGEALHCLHRCSEDY